LRARSRTCGTCRRSACGIEPSAATTRFGRKAIRSISCLRSFLLYKSRSPSVSSPMSRLLRPARIIAAAQSLFKGEQAEPTPDSTHNWLALPLLVDPRGHTLRVGFELGNGMMNHGAHFDFALPSA